MCRVLNMSEFWMFKNFRKHDRALNLRRDAIIEELYSGSMGIPAFRICKVAQDSEYNRTKTNEQQIYVFKQ